MLVLVLHLLVLALDPAFNHALAPPPSAFLTKGPRNDKKWTPRAATTPKPRNAITSPSGERNRGANRRLGVDGFAIMMVRGGGDTDGDDGTDDGDGESSDGYDRSSDDETEVDDETKEDDSSDDEEEGIADPPSPEELERAEKSAQLSSQSRNFGIATALWASLLFDAVLNKSKRSVLFPSFGSSDAAAASLSATALPTALLASGFALASGVSFLVWRDMEIEADALSSDDGESAKGDWFLSLSSTAGSGDGDDLGEPWAKFATQTRAGLCLHLSLFGSLCLAAHAGYYFSNRAPFLGMTAVIINAHNTLACVGALAKEEGTREALLRPLGLFRGGEGGGSPNRPGSFPFRVAAIAAWARCVPLCGSILSTGSELTRGGGAEAVVANGARRLCLQVASLARLTLVAGVSQALCASPAAVAARRDGARGHPFFDALGGALGAGCLGVGGAALFEALRSSVPVGASGGAAGGLAVALFGLFAVGNSLVGFSADRKRTVG